MFEPACLCYSHYMHLISVCFHSVATLFVRPARFMWSAPDDLRCLQHVSAQAAFPCAPVLGSPSPQAVVPSAHPELAWMRAGTQDLEAFRRGSPQAGGSHLLCEVVRRRPSSCTARARKGLWPLATLHGVTQHMFVAAQCQFSAFLETMLQPAKHNSRINCLSFYFHPCRGNCQALRLGAHRPRRDSDLAGDHSNQ